MNSFMQSTTVNQFKELFPKPATSAKQSAGKVTVTLKLQNKWGDSTIADLEKLVMHFGVICHLSIIKHGCIAALWLFSVGDIQKLKNAVATSTRLFLDSSVQGVHIDDEVVWHLRTGIHKYNFIMCACAHNFKAEHAPQIFMNNDHLTCNLNKLCTLH